MFQSCFWLYQLLSVRVKLFLVVSKSFHVGFCRFSMCLACLMLVRCFWIVLCRQQTSLGYFILLHFLCMLLKVVQVVEIVQIVLYSVFVVFVFRVVTGLH